MLEANVVNYNASISASEKGSQWAQALALLREMSDRRLESNVVSYSASVSASEKGSQWAQALSLLREMSDRRLESKDFHNVVCITNLLHQFDA